MKEPYKLISFTSLEEKSPVHGFVENVDLVIIRYGNEVSEIK